MESTGLKTRFGDHAAAAVVARHHDLVRALLAAHGGREVDSAGDGFFLTFETPSAAAGFALELQAAHRADTELPAVRVGIHLGEVTERPAPTGSSKPLLVEGLAVDLAARIQSLARPGQVLLSRAAFDAARQRLRAEDLRIETAWRAHGPYLFKGLDEPIEIGEAGIAGSSPLEAPPDSDKARRAVAAGDELTLGWRPAIGLLIPGREHWRLVEQLGTGAIGEVWLAAHDKTRARRVFKFCFEAARVRGLKREVVLLRLLRERLGERRDIAQVLDWEFERPPFFLETAYTEAGDLLEWSNRKGGIAAVPLTDRIEIAAQAAEALAAAHEAGILHKDIKPSNLLISEADPAGGPRVCLTDFGIGLVTSREALSSAGVTVAGMTETLLSSSSSTTGAGTRLYMAPEVVEGRPATERSDVYGLGVVLYQMAIGDFSRSLAPGWERAVADEVLREDIAAAVDGDAAHRLGSARELATRLRGLDRRRAERHAQERGRVAAATSGRRRRILLAASAATLLVVVVGAFFLSQQRALRSERARAEQVRWAREEALPEIARLASTGDFVSAFAIAERADAVIPTDPVLAERWVEIAATGALGTEPPGARISVQPYAADPEGEWQVLGESPLVRIRLPRGVYRWRIEKDGFEPVELARRPPNEEAPNARLLAPFAVELVPTGTIPAGMVRVPGGSYRVWLSGFDLGPPVAVEPFFIDRFETTNREYREFVESGAYGDGVDWPDGPDARGAARTRRPDRAARSCDLGTGELPRWRGRPSGPGRELVRGRVVLPVPRQAPTHRLPLGPRRVRPRRAVATTRRRDRSGEQSSGRRARPGRAASRHDRVRCLRHGGQRQGVGLQRDARRASLPPRRCVERARIHVPRPRRPVARGTRDELRGALHGPRRGRHDLRGAGGAGGRRLVRSAQARAGVRRDARELPRDGELHRGPARRPPSTPETRVPSTGSSRP